MIQCRGRGEATRRATASCAALSTRQTKTSLCWHAVYGLRMSPVREHLRADAMKSGIVREVASDDVLSEPCLLQEFDLVTVRTEDLQFNADFRLVPR